MKKTSLLLLLFSVALLSCRKKPIEVVKPIRSKGEVIAALVAGGRYWRYEEVTRQAGDKTTYMLSDTSKEYYIEKVIIAPNTSYTFELDSTISMYPSGGPHGKLPYSKDLHFDILRTSVSFNYARWYWDETRQTVAMPDFLRGGFPNMRGVTGYIDPEFMPLYKSLSEAEAAGKPERINIIVSQNEEKEGLVTYTFTMRAAWVQSYLYGSGHNPYYSVTY